MSILIVGEKPSVSRAISAVVGASSAHKGYTKGNGHCACYIAVCEDRGDYAEKIAELPYKIVPGSKAVYRESIFLERAIVEERLRLAIGLPLRPIEEHKSVADGIEESAIAEKYYDPPLVNIIKFACNGCPETHYHVTDCCQGWLAHPCQEAHRA